MDDDASEMQWRYRQLLLNMFRFGTASCSSHHEASGQLVSAVCDEDLLFKNACGRSISGVLGVVGDLAVSDLMGDLTIPEEV